MEKVANVYKTDDLRRFRMLLNNRQVTESRVKAIMKSIRDNGYLISPIITNEKFEIIDGQGRYTAAKRMGLPVYYVSIPGIGIEECRAMNFCNSNWKVEDYVYSYSQDGNEAYIYLQNLLTAYAKQLGVNTIYAIAVQNTMYGGVKDKIVNGNLKFTEDEYKKAVKLCDYLVQFVPVLKVINGRKDIYHAAIRFLYTLNNCNMARLLEKCAMYSGDLYPCTTIMDALEMFEKIYNKRNREKEYFVDAYKRMQNERTSEVSKRWYDRKNRKTDGGGKE